MRAALVLAAACLWLAPSFAQAGSSIGGAGAAATSSPSGGLAVFRVNSAAGTNATVVKPAPGRLYTYNFCNTAAATRYLRFFDSATAPTPGSTAVAAGAITVAAGSCQQFTSAIGLAFQAGIAFDITGAAGDADATGVTAGDLQGFIGYQ